MTNEPPNPNQTSDQTAAENLLRSKISAIYANQNEQQPYNRSHNPAPSLRDEQLKRYHTAWQDYYRKYYEGYYKQQNQTTTRSSNQPANTATVSEKEAIKELKGQLLEQINQSAEKIKKNRYLKPLLAGLFVVALVFFVQYNSYLFGKVATFISPGKITEQDIIVDPSAVVVVDAEPRLIIPKINIDVPVLYDVGNDYNSQMEAMTKGIAHFSIPGASSHPGQIGNTVLSGHSSNDLFDSGDYKFIFAQLERLQEGDAIYAHYNSTRYTYLITKKEVVGPRDVQALIYPTDKPVMTLITCTPVGTAQNRLLVTAEQVSPDPGQSAPAPSEENSNVADIPGKQPTLIEKLFKLFGD